MIAFIKIYCLLIFFFFSQEILSAQACTPFKLYGIVYSSMDTLPISGISIYIFFSQYKTNKKGYFEINGFVDEYEGFFIDKEDRVKIRFIDKNLDRPVQFSNTDTLVILCDDQLTIFLQPKLESD